MSHRCVNNTWASGNGLRVRIGSWTAFSQPDGIDNAPHTIRESRTGTGILTGGTDLGMFIGAMLMGQLSELFGFSIIFGSAAATLFLGLGIFFRIRPMIINR